MESLTLFSLFCLVAGAIIALVIRKLIFEKNHVPVHELEIWKQKYQETNTAKAVNESLLANAKEDIKKSTIALETRNKEVERFIGPSWTDIANKYYNVSDSIRSRLSEKIRIGGSGSWGSVPMAPHPGLSKANADSIINYILLKHT